MIHLEIIDSLDRWEQIGSEWSELESALTWLTPFQTPEWLFTWWRHFGSGRLSIFTFRGEDHRLVGILPAFLHPWEGRRQLTLIGSGVSDYLEPSIAASDRDAVTKCLREHLTANSQWDICSWQDLLADTPLSSLGDDHALIVQAEPDLACSEISIHRGFDEFWADRPSGLRRNVRRYRDKAEQIAPIEVSTIHSPNEACLEALIRLHSARWREQGEPGMIAANRSAGFLRDVVKQFAPRQMALFFALRFQGAISAVILCFPYQNALYAYLSAFDPANSAFGFGRILLYEALQYAFQEQYASWNFLRGREDYKFDWGAREILKTRLTVTRGQAEPK